MMRIKKIRLKAKLTLHKLGEQIGVSAQTILNWENEITIPSLSHLIKLAAFFNVSLDYLVGFNSSSNLFEYIVRYISKMDAERIKEVILELFTNKIESRRK
jgi:transcriptional regulator with XRE-family HTH domain